MEREVIPILGDGNCLFRAVSYCLFNNQGHHREIRLMVVEKVKSEWEYYRHFIMGDLSYRLPISSALDYENLVSLDGEYAGHVELYCIGQLFPNYLFRVYRDDNNESQDYGTGNIICNLLFSGNLDGGHYSVLNFRPTNFARNESSSFVKDSNCNVLQQTTNDRRKRRKTLTGRREKITKRAQNKQNYQKQKYRRAVLENISNDVPSFSLGNLDKTCDYCSALYYLFLAPKNEHRNHINTKVLNLLPGLTKTYVSVNHLVTEEENEILQFPVEFLNSLELGGLPPHVLTLKVGAIVMLLRNLHVSQGLLNGTRLIVKHMYENCLDLEIITGVKAGQRVLIPRIDLMPSDASLPFSFKRRQFPIRLAFCMTINKAQGQTLERVGIYLQEPVFSHGQLYVAMSRARSFDNLKVQIVPNCHMTSNVVYKEVL